GFLLCAFVYGWQAAHCLDDVKLMVFGRDSASGRVSIDLFLSYGPQVNQQTLVRFLTGWPSYGANTNYIGLLPLLCVVWGVFNIPTPVFWALLAPAAVLALLSLGGVAARLIYYFPMMSVFRHIGLVYGPVRMLLLLGAGFGLDRLVQWISTPG